MITEKKIDAAMKNLSTQAKEIYGEKLKEIILFGSCARGDYDNESDVDIMVLLDIPADDIRKERSKLEPIIWNLDIKYDYDLLFVPIVKSYAEFNYWREIIPFYKSVKQEGIRYA